MNRKIPANLESMARDLKGAYILEFEFTISRSPIRVEVGKLGPITLETGYYYYIGSARGGLRGRLIRHFTGEGKVHWHIDYLTKVIPPVRAFYVVSDEKIENKLALVLSRICTPMVKGFGCSDVRGSVTHLFYSKKRMEYCRELKEFGEVGIIE